MFACFGGLTVVCGVWVGIRQIFLEFAVLG